MSHPLYIADWIGWSACGQTAPANPVHNLSDRLTDPALPALLRRRLDLAGRAACEILSLLVPCDSCPIIYASRHGDLHSSLDMLKALTQGEKPSPSKFSMSVHNAVTGVYSIARKHHGPIQALAASGHEFDAMMLEAQGYLATGHEAVVVIFSEGEMPLEYAEHTAHCAQPSVVGLKLTNEPGIRLYSSQGSHSEHPTPADLIAWLDTPTSAALVSAQYWHLERA